VRGIALSVGESSHTGTQFFVGLGKGGPVPSWPAFFAHLEIVQEIANMAKKTAYQAAKLPLHAFSK
jgi:hypothetical protein